MQKKSFFSKPAGYAVIAVLIAAMFGIGYFGGRLLFAKPTPPTPTPAPPGAAVLSRPVPTDFTLTGTNGEPISLSSLRGRAVLLFFGYTHCPEECPTTLATFTRVKEALGDQADDVAFVFVSVDGLRDTPQVVADYLAQFDPSFIGMTGDDADLAQVGEEYGLVVERVNAEGTPIALEADHDEHQDGEDENAPDNDNYFVLHTSPSFVIDPQGNLRLIYFYDVAPPAAIADGLRQVLQG